MSDEFDAFCKRAIAAKADIKALVAKVAPAPCASKDCPEMGSALLIPALPFRAGFLLGLCPNHMEAILLLLPTDTPTNRILLTLHPLSLNDRLAVLAEVLRDLYPEGMP